MVLPSGKVNKVQIKVQNGWGFQKCGSLKLLKPREQLSEFTVFPIIPLCWYNHFSNFW